MISPLEQVIAQMNKIEHHLMYHLIMEQQETNRLLRHMIENKQESPEPIDNIADLKRPELIKRMAKLANKPPGWNKMRNDEIISHLKGGELIASYTNY